jgi:flagellar motility protein MotE (MotC chaperone)
MAYLSSNINELSKFMETSRDNIEIRNKNLNENVKELLKVMNSLKDIEEKKDEYALTLDRIEQILRTLEKKENTKKES